MQGRLKSLFDVIIESLMSRRARPRRAIDGGAARTLYSRKLAGAYDVRCLSSYCRVVGGRGKLGSNLSLGSRSVGLRFCGQRLPYSKAVCTSKSQPG